MRTATTESETARLRAASNGLGFGGFSCGEHQAWVIRAAAPRNLRDRKYVSPTVHAEVASIRLVLEAAAS